MSKWESDYESDMYRCNRQSDSVTTSLRQLLRSEKYADFTIICEDEDGTSESFRVHRAIICAQSEYFETLCGSDFSEASEANVVLKEDGIEYIREMINFFYSGYYRIFEKHKTESDCMMFHLRMFALADIYRALGLRQYAMDGINHDTPIEQIPVGDIMNAVSIVYAIVGSRKDDDDTAKLQDRLLIPLARHALQNPEVHTLWNGNEDAWDLSGWVGIDIVRTLRKEAYTAIYDLQDMLDFINMFLSHRLGKRRGNGPENGENSCRRCCKQFSLKDIHIGKLQHIEDSRGDPIVRVYHICNDCAYKGRLSDYECPDPSTAQGLYLEGCHEYLVTIAPGREISGELGRPIGRDETRGLCNALASGAKSYKSRSVTVTTPSSNESRTDDED